MFNGLEVLDSNFDWRGWIFRARLARRDRDLGSSLGIYRRVREVGKMTLHNERTADGHIQVNVTITLYELERCEENCGFHIVTENENPCHLQKVQRMS